MTASVMTAFWSMTINNYDETSLALVRNGYPDYCREIIHTLEVGAEGTPHIQAWIKLQRQQRLSFVKKLFPRGHFKPLTSDEYVHNTKQYVQKDDKTTASAHVHSFHDPVPDPVTELMSVMRAAKAHFMDDAERWTEYKQTSFMRAMTMEEHARVQEKPKLAKFYVSPLYTKVKKEFWWDLLAHISAENERDTHTHTHIDEKLSHEGGITDAGNDSDRETEDQGGGGEEDESCSEDEYDEEYSGDSSSDDGQED